MENGEDSEEEQEDKEEEEKHKEEDEDNEGEDEEERGGRRRRRRRRAVRSNWRRTLNKDRGPGDLIGLPWSRWEMMGTFFDERVFRIVRCSPV